jgi:RNA polymerase sigma-70 factor, ECF subfamily
MQHVDDWELVARAQAGDMASFAELVQRYRDPVIHFCARMLNSVQDAEDLAQETFVRLYRHLGRLTPRARFSTVVFGIARNLALNALRDRRRRGLDTAQSLDAVPYRDPAAVPPDRQAELRDLAKAIEDGIERLSIEHREILLLREVHGLDYDAIARVTGCRKGTVKSRLARAREQLRQRLSEIGDGLL